MGISVFPQASTVSSAVTKWTLLDSYASTTAFSTINFNSISQNYRRLRLSWGGLVKNSSSGALLIRINNDSANNYNQWGYYINSLNGATDNIAYEQVNMNHITITPISEIFGGQYFHGYVDIANYSEVGPKFYESKARFRGPSSAFVYVETPDGLYTTGASTPAITSMNFIISVDTASCLATNSMSGVQLYGGN